MRGDFDGPKIDGERAPMIAPAGAEINAAEYVEIVEIAYLPDLHQLCGFRPTCVPSKKAPALTKTMQRMPTSPRCSRDTGEGGAAA